MVAWPLAQLWDMVKPWGEAISSRSDGGAEILRVGSYKGRWMWSEGSEHRWEPGKLTGAHEDRLKSVTFSCMISMVVFTWATLTVGYPAGEASALQHGAKFAPSTGARETKWGSGRSCRNYRRGFYPKTLSEQQATMCIDCKEPHCLLWPSEDKKNVADTSW